jgi:hypothetical protein
LAPPSDKQIVSRFVDNAMQLLEAAESVVQAGHTPSDLTVLITDEGGIRMVTDSDWSLDALQLHHGARMAYRVSQTAAHVRVEGRAGSRTCLFETTKPERAARLLLQRPPNQWIPPRMIEPPALQSGVA